MLSLPRRHFLALAGAVVLGVTGCQVSDPVIRGGPTAPPPEPTPSATPALPGQGVALAHEVELAALATQAHEAAERLRLGPGATAVVGWMAAAHDLHVTALLNPDPAGRATTAPTPGPGSPPRPSPSAALTAGTRDQAIQRLHDRLDRALTDYRRAAIDGQGSRALVWGSLAAYARSAQIALSRDVSRPDPPAVPVRPLEPWSDAEAEQQALRQVHALVYGYQVAIPWLAKADRERAYDLLVGRRALRDSLAGTLRERGLAAPAADPAYALPEQPTDHDSATRLLWHMESAFTPFAGAWLAAATDTDARREALESLEQSAGLCVDWGGPLLVWPGWPL